MTLHEFRHVSRRGTADSGGSDGGSVGGRRPTGAHYNALTNASMATVTCRSTSAEFTG